jgi:hypothetical protein
MVFDMNKDFVFTTDKNGNLTGGGFTINSDLLKNTLGGTNNETNIQSGGNASVASAAILNIFTDLAVPAGLFFTQKQVQKNNTIKYEHKQESVEDGLYDKLLGLLEPERRVLHGRKTRSKRENGKKNTRKNR